MPKVKTEFVTEGMKLFRNGEHIATREKDCIIMEDGFEKFEFIAKKKLDAKQFCIDNNLEWLGLSTAKRNENLLGEASTELPSTSDVNEVKPEQLLKQDSVEAIPSQPESNEVNQLAELVKKQQEQIEQLLEMNADRIESAPRPINMPEASEAEKELARANERISILEKELENKSNTYVLEVPEEPPRLVRRKDKENPFRIPEEQFKEAMATGKIPPCPAMDWRGTKTPECISWLEKYFPDFAEERLWQFRENQEEARLKKLRKEAKIKKEREIISQFPSKSEGSLYPYKVHSDDE